MKSKVAVVLIALLLVLVVVLFCQIFNVRNVEVVAEGALPVGAEELLKKSGIEWNGSIFALSKEAVRKRVEQTFPDRSVAVDRVEKVFPNVVRLYVRARRPILGITLSDGSGVVPTDRDFQLTDIKTPDELDYDVLIRVSGATVASSFDTDELIYLRRVLYAFFRSGFDETSLVWFIKEFRFTEDGLVAVLRTEENAQFRIDVSAETYEDVVKSVSEVYQNFLKTPENEREGKIYGVFGAVPSEIAG